MQNTNTDADTMSVIDVNNVSNLIIVGHNAKIIREAKVSPIYADNSDYIFYPGMKTTDSTTLTKYETFRDCGNIYLNRYVNVEDGQLNSTIYSSMHIVYPNNCKQNPDENTSNTWNSEYELKQDTTDTSYSKTNYFPNTYWQGTSHTYATSGSGKYHFEDPKPTIKFNNNNVFVLNTDNEFLEYDRYLWNQCSVDSGKYSLQEFVNIKGNEDKYIDLDTIEELFTNGKTYNTTGLLNNMPGTLYVGLIGNKDIRVKPGTNELKLFGDNTQYTGTLYLPTSINTIAFGKQESIIEKIKFIKYDDEKNKVDVLFNNNINTDELTIGNNLILNLKGNLNLDKLNLSNKGLLKLINSKINTIEPSNTTPAKLNFDEYKQIICLSGNVVTEVDNMNKGTLYYTYSNLKCNSCNELLTINNDELKTKQPIDLLNTTCSNCGELFNQLNIEKQSVVNIKIYPGWALNCYSWCTCGGGLIGGDWRIDSLAAQIDVKSFAKDLYKHIVSKNYKCNDCQAQLVWPDQYYNDTNKTMNDMPVIESIIRISTQTGWRTNCYAHCEICNVCIKAGNYNTNGNYQNIRLTDFLYDLYQYITTEDHYYCSECPAKFVWPETYCKNSSKNPETVSIPDDYQYEL